MFSAKNPPLIRLSLRRTWRNLHLISNAVHRVNLNPQLCICHPIHDQADNAHWHLQQMAFFLFFSQYDRRFLVGLAAYRPLCAFFFFPWRDGPMKLFPPVHLLTNIRPWWGSKVTEQTTLCASAPASGTLPGRATLIREGKALRGPGSCTVRGNVFYGRHLRRIDQAQGLVLGMIGSTVYASARMGY